MYCLLISVSLDCSFFLTVLCGILKNLALEDIKHNDMVVIFLNAFLFAENTSEKVSIHITGEEIW